MRVMPGNPVDGDCLATSDSPITSATGANDTASSVSKWLAEDVYAKAILGIQEVMPAPPQLPTLQAFRLCVHLYFERLHPNFPFINKMSFLSGEPHWILLLAVAGAGAAYLRSSQGSQWKDTLMQALEEILSRRLYRFRHTADTMQPASGMHEMGSLVDELLPIIQAKVLHMLCMLHSSTSYIHRHAVFERAELVQWCSYLNLVPVSGVSAPSTSGRDVQRWIKAQSLLRTGMMIWVSGVNKWMATEPIPDRQNRVLTSLSVVGFYGVLRIELQAYHEASGYQGMAALS